MSNQEVLTKVIEKAIANGWKGSPYSDFMRWHGDMVKTDLLYGDGVWLTTVVYMPPFDFAKALWGDDEVKLFEDSPDVETDPYGEYASYTALPSWQYHLQNMVIADDPIKYLASSIELVGGI